jgi:hypothetical protein
MKDKFEYKILNILRSHLKKEEFQFELIETLNKLGEESWELINTEGLNEGSIFWRVGETTDILFLFKRRKL